MPDISEVLVSTGWVAAHLDDPSVVIAEIDTDLDAGYNQGHVPGAVGWNLRADLEDQTRRDMPSIAQIEKLLGEAGIDNNTTVVLYGDNNNRSATWGFWTLKYYRHKDVRIMDGGRIAWTNEGRPFSTERPAPVAKTYKAGVPDSSLRATKDYIVKNLRKSSVRFLDTRTPEEFSGEFKVPEIYRSGRIPGAVHIEWDDGATENGTFRPVEELRRMYEDKGFNPDQEVISYCRLGVKASYSWFVLKYLLGYERVRNYDGSWMEWGNSIGVPIETDAAREE
jgi:thiosulfate/3-mercaptopyruvate sulfurtransferase